MIQTEKYNKNETTQSERKRKNKMDSTDLNSSDMDSTQISDQHQSMLPQMHSSSASDSSEENHGKYIYYSYSDCVDSLVVIVVHECTLSLLSCVICKKLLNQISYGMI